MINSQLVIILFLATGLNFYIVIVNKDEIFSKIPSFRGAKKKGSEV